MIDFKELVASETRKHGTKCSVPNLLAKLDDDTRAQVETALQTDSVAAEAIARALKKLGHKIQGQTLCRHRRGDCDCA